MKTEPTIPVPLRRKRVFLRICIPLIIIAAAYGGWREYDFQQAALEAKTGDLEWIYEAPFDAIQKNWRAAFQLATWRDAKREFTIIDEVALKLVRDRNLLHRLRPRNLKLVYYEDPKKLEVLKGVESLRELTLDARRVVLSDFSVLQSLPYFESLTVDCDIDAEVLESLKKLTRLKKLHLTGNAYFISQDQLRQLQAALPNTRIKTSSRQEFYHNIASGLITNRLVLKRRS